MEQDLKNKEIEDLHKKLIHQLIGEQADVTAQMLSDGRYGVEIIIKDVKYWAVREAWGSEQQVMDNVLNAIEEFIIT